MKKYNVAVVGASGAVGEEIFCVLQEQKFPIAKIIPLASKRSSGEEIKIFGQKHRIKETTPEIFAKEEVEIAFFSAGGEVSKEYAPHAVGAGCLVIDNTSHFRMDPSIPLVVPGVNDEDIAQCNGPGIIANPNCSTIQMVQVLAPLHKAFGIKRVDVSTYQAVSGAGKRGMEELVHQMQKFFAFELEDAAPQAFPHRIALNLIPQIDKFLPNDFTKEEMKMIQETNKILHSQIAISATCVRVPVLRSHSESISITFEREVPALEARKILEQAKHIKVCDAPKDLFYPMPMNATDTDETYVGRIRNDLYDRKILHLWCVADQLRVGAATNAVRIAELWIQKN